MTATYQRKPGVVTRHIAGETILVPMKNRLADLLCLFVLNPVGEFIWERLDGKTSLADVADQVAEAFEVDPAQARRDCEEFLQQLIQADLVLAT